MDYMLLSFGKIFFAWLKSDQSSQQLYLHRQQEAPLILVDAFPAHFLYSFLAYKEELSSS